tara:strand:+ start:3222 stop:4409 length:1188 start_codon:yes stop_codon:yes gene_type:complete
LKDLTNLKTFIIDSENPNEIDDAVSLEIGENNVKYIWVHISYPCKLFEYDSDEDIKARGNCSSIYLIDKYIPMLSKEIIDKANLKQNKLSETISACIEINENGSIKGYELTEAIIKPNYEITYEDTNEILELEPKEEYELIILNNLLKKSFEYRKSNGALMFETPTSTLSYKKEIVIIEKVYKTDAHQLISEAMILMGYVISDFLKNRNIPAPYRSQKINCDPKNILEQNANSLIKYSILKQYIGKSFISLKPGRHETLGLNSYVQATSPLRRYLDLVVQRQLYLFLNKRQILTEDSINLIIQNIKSKQLENNNIIKENKLIYLRKYFDFHKHILHKIIFIRWVNNKKNIALVFFTELNLETLINLYISTETYTNKVYKVKYSNGKNSNLLEFIN